MTNTEFHAIHATALRAALNAKRGGDLRAIREAILSCESALRSLNDLEATERKRRYEHKSA